MAKQSPHERRITERMARGVLSRDGFLGSDRRPLSEILDADRSAVAGLEVTHELLAERLAAALQATMAGLGAPVKLGEELTGVYREAMGRIPCPWGGCGVFAKGQVELSDERTGRKWYLTALSIHLIARHGFYQGRGSPYRLEPEDLCRLFRLGRHAADARE
jgi:hypothetical protein